MNDDTNTRSMRPIGDNLKNTFTARYPNVNNVKSDSLDNVQRSNVNVSSKNETDKIKAIGEDLANRLNDTKNLNYYLKCGREHQASFLYECLHIVQEAQREGRITTTPPKYFVGVVKRKSNKS